VAIASEFPQLLSIAGIVVPLKFGIDIHGHRENAFPEDVD
jgi:hypothetical protein